MCTSNKCKGCGYVNDSLLTNCLYCKKPLDNIDVDKISNQTLILEASKWVQTSSEFQIVLNNGLFPKTISHGEIIGNAYKYINLMTVRGVSNSIMESNAQKLSIELKENIKKAKNKVKWIYLRAFIFGFCPIVIFYLYYLLK